MPVSLSYDSHTHLSPVHIVNRMNRKFRLLGSAFSPKNTQPSPSMPPLQIHLGKALSSSCFASSPFYTKTESKSLLDSLDTLIPANLVSSTLSARRRSVTLHPSQVRRKSGNTLPLYDVYSLLTVLELYRLIRTIPRKISS